MAVPSWGCPGCDPRAAEESHPLHRVETGPVTSACRRYRDQTLARSRAASDTAVAFWSGMQRGHSGRQRGWWGGAGSRSLLGKADLWEGREGADHFALTGYGFRFLADSAYESDEWLQFRLLVTKTTGRLCILMKSWWLCCQTLHFLTFSYSHLCRLLSQNSYWWIDFCWTDSATCRTELQGVAVLGPKSLWAFSVSEPHQVSRLGWCRIHTKVTLTILHSLCLCVAWSAFFKGCNSF